MTVPLKLKPYRHHFVAHRSNEKLSPRFYGPFKIVAKVGPVAYRLQLLVDAKIHPVFHVSQLKHMHGSLPTESPLSPQLDNSFEWQLEPKAVLGIKPNIASLEVLIKWRGL